MKDSVNKRRNTWCGQRPPAFLLLIVLVTNVLSGCQRFDAWQLKREIQAARQAYTEELQQKRALVISESSLTRLDRIDVAVSIPKGEIDRFNEIFLHALQNNPELKRAQVKATAVAIELADQEITATITVERKLADATVTAKVIASGLVGALDGGIIFNLTARGIELEDISLSPGKKDKSTLVPVINKALDESLGLIKVAIDVSVNRNPKSAVVLWLDQEALINQDLQKSDTPTLTFSPKTIQTALKEEATGILVDRNRIMILLKAEFVSPVPPTERLPDIPATDELVTIPKADAEKRSKAYQAALGDRLKQAFGTEFAATDAAIFAITKAAASRAINHGLSQGPFTADAKLNDRAKASTDLTVQISEKNCEDLIQGCSFKNVCNNRSICQTQTVQTVEDLACKVACASSPNVGVWGFNPRKKCEDACGTVNQVVLTPIHNASCDAFVAWDNLHGGTGCAVASNIDKASCDAQKNLAKSACDVEQEVRRFYEHNAFATLDSDLQPDVTLTVSVQNASLAEDLSSLNVVADASGSGNIDVGLGCVTSRYIWVPAEVFISVSNRMKFGT